MNMDSESIQKKEFHIVFKGYKPEEVDEFLDSLAVEFEKLKKANTEIQNALDKKRFEESEDSVEMKKVIQDTLVSAHKVAEDIKQKAKREAEELVKEAVAKEEDSYKDLLSKKTQLEKDISELGEEYDDFKKKISNLIDEFKELTSKTEISKTISLTETKKKNLDIGRIIIDKDFKEDKEETDKKESLSLVDELEAESNKEKEEEIEEKEEESKEKEEESKEGEEEADKEKDITEEGKKKEFDQTDEIEGEEDSGYKPKRVKKKMDIANPDIINDFFKTDED
jgi:cell division initiation protein